jgi:hypothetical protein
VSSEEVFELVSDDDDEDDDSIDRPLPGAWKMKPLRLTPSAGARPPAALLATGNGRRLFRGVSSVISALRLGRCVRRRKLLRLSIKW